MVASQDNRLLWHVPDIATEVERQIERQPSFLQQRSQLEQYLRWQEQQYQDAAAVAGAFSWDASAASVWQGHVRVREQLELLWRDYSATAKNTDRREDLDVINGFYKDLKHQFCMRLPWLRVKLVRYPAPVFFPVPPVTVLVSKVKALPLESLRASFFQAVESLAGRGFL